MAETGDTTQQVDVREKWPHEALDFTPWLAENLNLLGDARGLKLELVQTEYQVGPFSLDILANEVNKRVKVAIENQYDWTDHSHLGQALTYAAGVDAHIVIWVVPEFMNEHGDALDWLNRWTSDEIEFYGVEVSVTKTGDSFDNPSFRKVVYPGGWERRDYQPTISPRARQFRDFFQPLINEMLQTRFANRSTQYFDFTGRFFPSSFNPDIGYAVSLWENGAQVSLYVRTWDSIERNKRMFEELQGSKAQIEACLGPKLEWHKYQAYSFFTVSLRRDGVNLAEDGTIDDPPEKLKETRAWMIEHLPKLKEVFDPRLEKILNEFPAEETGE